MKQSKRVIGMLKAPAKGISAAAATGLVSMQAMATETPEGVDASAVVTYLEGAVTSNIGLIATAILTVGGLVYGVGVLRGFMKA